MYMDVGFRCGVGDFGNVGRGQQLFFNYWLVQCFVVVVNIYNIYVFSQLDVSQMIVNYSRVGEIDFILLQIVFYYVQFRFVVGVIVGVEVRVNQYVVKGYILIFEDGYYGIVWFFKICGWEVVGIQVILVGYYNQFVVCCFQFK